MDVIPLFILAFSCVLSLGNTSCNSRRCRFKAREISVPRRRIDFHVCGSQIFTAVSHFCSNPRPKTKPPTTVQAKVKTTTATTIKTSQHTALPTSTTSSPKMIKSTSSVERLTTKLNIKTTPSSNHSQAGNHSKTTQATLNGTKARSAPRTMSGNNSTVLTNESNVNASNATGVANSSLLHDPPLLTTLDADEPNDHDVEKDQIHLSQEEASAFLTSHANSPGYTLVEECCIEGCVAEEIYEYCY